MIFKVFYQKDKSRSPRRETTETLYLDLDVATKEEGIIAARELLATKTLITWNLSIPSRMKPSNMKKKLAYLKLQASNTDLITKRSTLDFCQN